MRKIILTILILVICCTGCGPKTITLIQPAENITGITLMYSDNSGHKVICELSVEELWTFADELCTVRVYRPSNPSGALGYFYVHIQYSTGEQEFFGTDSCKYISSSGEPKHNWRLSVSYGELYDLFSSYVGEETMNALRER